jgi:hypothetical protein
MNDTDRALRDLGRLVTRTVIRGGVYKMLRRLHGPSFAVAMAVAAVGYVLLQRMH